MFLLFLKRDRVVASSTKYSRMTIMIRNLIDDHASKSKETLKLCIEKKTIPESPVFSTSYKVSIIKNKFCHINPLLISTHMTKVVFYLLDFEAGTKNGGIRFDLKYFYLKNTKFFFIIIFYLLFQL